MKNLGICYLLFIILLSIMPCADDNASHYPDGQSISAVSHPDDFETDNCSPICLCACCGQSLVAPIHMPFLASIPIVELPTETIFQVTDLQKRASSIWQPPKLMEYIS